MGDVLMRSIMNGSLAFGLVSVAVKVYAATEDRELTAHQVHSKDYGKISYRKVCSNCGETVESRDISKMFTIDDKTAVLTDDDISQIESGKSREISVQEFVPADSIEPMMYDKCYFIGPAAPEAMKAYALLVETLEASNLVAIVQLTLRQKTRLAMLSVTGKGIMLLHTLRWPDEIRPAVLPALDTAVLERKRAELTDAERGMAAQLVESMTGVFEPAKYVDSFSVELRELVMSKLEQSDEAPEDVSDLLAKLSKSVAPKVAQKVCKADIRTWARSNGIKIGDRGRIPRDVVDRFEKATA